MTELSYLRWPHVSGDVVSFVAEDDVWVAPLAGGRAWRVSADHAPVVSPRLSPDGTQVAWTSARENVSEVFTAPVEGGTTRRLTWWGASTTVTGWLSDDELLVSTSAGQHSRVPVAVALPVAGGPARPLPWGRVASAATQPGGAGVLVSTTSFSEPAWRKRYRGGTASRLWLDAAGTGDFTRLLGQLTSSLTTPVWASGRLGFTSDHDGVAQLWSLDADAATAALAVDPAADLADSLHRHTDAEFYVRHASSDGTRVAWTSAGSLWTLADLDPATGAAPEPLAIRLGGPRTGRAPHRIAAAGNLGTTAPDRTGRASAVELRGTVQWLPHRDGPVRVLAATPGVRARMPVVLGTTGRVAWVTDAGGEDAVQVAPVGAGTVPVTGEPDDGTAPGVGTRFAEGQLGTVLALVASPDGAVLAIASDDTRVLTLDTATGALHEVSRVTDGDAHDLAFSPDSRWLAWSAPGPEPLAHIVAAELDGALPVGEPVEVTPLRFTDTSPTFTSDGRHLAFLSVRSLDPVYDAVVFDMSFPGGCRPYLVPLAADTPSPFDPSGQGRGAEPKTEAEQAASGAVAGATRSSAPAVPRTTLDPAGIADRIRPFPVPAGVLSQLTAVDGGVVWLRSGPAGVLGDDRTAPDDPPAKPVLERWGFTDHASVVLSPDIDAVRVTGDLRRLVVRSGDDVIVLPADRPAPPEDKASADVRLTVDLSRVTADVDPDAEWHQEFDEAGRRMRDAFWRADLDGVDWAAQLARYRPLVDAIASTDDLVDLLWETAGEFATSHAYVSPGKHPDPARAQGLLGADLSRDPDGTWRVARVLPGESSDARARSPLAAPAVGVGPGDAVVAVGGRAVDPADGPNALLVGTAGKPVELTVVPAGGGGPRTVTVVPVGDETPLRYHVRVADRRERTHALSGGRLGYVHVPDMVGSGWAQLHRDLRVETAHDGLVVDVRENSGGHLSELVLEKISRQVRAWVTGRGLSPRRYPADAPRGAVVVVTDEFAGSDGDIINAVSQAAGVGPVVGQRTWGGVIGIDGRYTLVDGTSITQPRYSFWFTNHGWGVENHGVDPDVDVVLSPQDFSAGRDPQLERAVEIALSALEVTPAAQPPTLPPPRRGRA